MLPELEELTSWLAVGIFLSRMDDLWTELPELAELFPPWFWPSVWVTMWLISYQLCDSLATSSRFQASSELATIFDACFYKLCPLVKGIEGWRWAQDTDITIISVSVVSELPYQTSSAHFVLLITEYCDLVVSKSKLKITPLTENS